jgi:hypothetical protein
MLKKRLIKYLPNALFYSSTINEEEKSNDGIIGKYFNNIECGERL